MIVNGWPGKTDISRPHVFLHSGQQWPESSTMGCIRTTETFMEKILNLIKTDTLTNITVQ